MEEYKNPKFNPSKLQNIRYNKKNSLVVKVTAKKSEESWVSILFELTNQKSLSLFVDILKAGWEGGDVKVEE